MLKSIIKAYKKIKLYFDCLEADTRDFLTCGSCFSLFPPSFYMTHTEEEIKEITEKELISLRKKIAELEDIEINQK